MSLEVQLLWLPRAGASTLEYEALCVHDRSDSLPFRIALADPDPETVRPELWADLLARGFVDEGALTLDSVGTDLFLRQAAYAACVASEPLASNKIEPARTGFAGLTISPDNSWRLVCSPGYCVVKLCSTAASHSLVESDADDETDDPQTANRPVCIPRPGALANRSMIS
ncbi:MAG: hypothetical protein HKN13_02575, partial [Rhodothermales bacterium]|nr:hypothetical protein [Rhodothermales bacterium]